MLVRVRGVRATESPRTASVETHDPRAGEHIEVRPVGRRLSRDAEFTAFVQESQHELLRTAWLLSGDPHRAEELTQQALERTYLSWGRAREGEPLAYARRVLVNLRIDTWRRRRREVLLDPANVPHRAVGGGDADQYAERDRLMRALVTLPPRQRRVVVLRHVLDLPEAEVAADMSISIGTVKSANARALARLRELLSPSPESPGSTS